MPYIVKSSLDISGKIVPWNEQEVNKLIQEKEMILKQKEELVETEVVEEQEKEVTEEEPEKEPEKEAEQTTTNSKNSRKSKGQVK